MEIQTDIKRIKNVEGTVYLVLDNDNWIEIEAVTESDNEKKFVIKSYQHTHVSLEKMNE